VQGVHDNLSHDMLLTSALVGTTCLALSYARSEDAWCDSGRTTEPATFLTNVLSTADTVLLWTISPEGAAEGQWQPVLYSMLSVVMAGMSCCQLWCIVVKVRRPIAYPCNACGCVMPF